MWIDSHIHLFDIHRPETEWPTPQHPEVLYRNSYPSDFSAMVADTGIEKAVAVECVSGDKHEDENNLWTLELTKDAEQIGAVIGSIPLEAETFGETYQKYLAYPKFRGIRIRPDISLNMLSAFDKNLSFFVPEANVVEVVPAHFSNLYAVEPIIVRHPEIQFVIDHFAWFTTDGTEPAARFRNTLKDIARYAHVSIKLSGLFERCALRPCSRDPEYYHPMMETMLAVFGTERCMSDWPPSGMFGAYAEQVEITATFLRKYGTDAVERIMGENAKRIYRIE